MAAEHLANVSQSLESFRARPSTTGRIVLPGAQLDYFRSPTIRQQSRLGVEMRLSSN
jgi:hypothetical protein